MKKQYVIILMVIIFSMVVCAVSVSAKSGKRSGPVNINNAICKDLPESQVTNNSGVSIYKVKVGMVEFSANLSSCFDGCSTGFKKVAIGKNTIQVKMTALSPWKTIGTIGPFSYCKFYSVNMVTKSKKRLCAQLFERKETDPTFNNDKTKTMIGEVCYRTLPMPTSK